MDEYDVRPRQPRQSFEAFSGGNQQKLVLAKWLQLDPVVLLSHEPTQGVDVGARGQILGRLRQIADGGAAVVVASAEYEELAELSDRVLVFRHGRLIAELAGKTITHERILERCFAVDDPMALATAQADA
jgi:ribose transport system ATP-binding protein